MLGISLGDVFSWTFEWSDEYLLKYGNIMGIVKHILFDGVDVFWCLISTLPQRHNVNDGEDWGDYGEGPKMAEDFHVGEFL